MIRGNKGGLPPAAMQTSKPSHAGARRNATASISRPGDEQVVTDPGGIDPNTGRVTYADRNPNHYAGNRQRIDQQNTFQGATPQQANHKALYAERHPGHAGGTPMQRQPQQGGTQPPQAPQAQPPQQPGRMQYQPYPMPMSGGFPAGFGSMSGIDPGFNAGGVDFSQFRQPSPQDFQRTPMPWQNPKFAGPGSGAMQQMGGGMFGGGQMMPARNTGPAPMPTGKGLMSAPNGGMQRLSPGVYRDANGQTVRR